MSDSGSAGPKRARLVDMVSLLGMGLQVSNVIMQLSNPAVGHAVHESRVPSGSALKRPLKRARTTGYHLAVAAVGEQRDRDVLHEELWKVHAKVYSTAESPVRYSGNSKTLQLWVAACLYRYFLDQHDLLYGPMPPERAEEVYREAAVLGTILNVTPDMWPATRAAYEEYWNSQLDGLRIDEPVRRDLLSLADLSFLVRPWGLAGRILHKLLGGSYKFMTAAGLPEPFRQMMGFTWTERHQRRFDRLCAVVRVVDRFVPRWFFEALAKAPVLELRARRRLGAPIF
ncbi:MAG: oxygenase MpaB family protein [Segniliparus sp.]|uniref:oxygenase MpaB family protein n=1 Tax=Segniliparus sp. TaxID=2804064 RepID=UPI003F3FA454